VTSGTPTNTEIARLLTEIRTLMEFAGEPFFKFMAYERAAETVENAPPLGELARAGRLQELPGVGKTIAARIAELTATGTCAYLEELRARYPPTLIEVLAVPGVGMKTAQLMYERLGIASLADLDGALRADALAELPRLGPKSIENIRRGVLAARGRARRTPLGVASALAAELVTMLAERSPAHDLTPAGSLRRQEATVGDIDVVCTSDAPEAVIAAFTAWERADAVVAEGGTKASVWLADGLQIDLRVLPSDVYGNLLQHFTGSREHNIQLRESAVRKGLRVSENGIVDLADGRTIRCRTEAEVYAALGLAEIPPEMRLGLGEIEAARDGTLPQVVGAADLRGDLRVRCDWIGGDDARTETLVAAAAARGHDYVALAAPLDPAVGAARVRERRAVAEALGARSGLRVLCAAEVALRPDGTPDADAGALAALELAIAVPGDAECSAAERTRALAAACAHPWLAVLGVPTGRRVGGFAGHDFDREAVFAAAAQSGTALEVDGDPERLDLPGALARQAKEAGATFTCVSGAHEPDTLGDIAYAVGQARRGWLTRAEVLNARSAAGVLAFVDAKRASARHAGTADTQG
jgi:DNA polymerase (family 10)